MANLSRDGLVVVDPEGRIVFANARAQALIQEGDGIQEIDGRLAMALTADNKRLERALQRGLTPSERRRYSAFQIRRTSGQRPFLFLLNELGRSQAKAGFLAIVIDPGANPSDRTEVFRGLFDLTEAEARLVVAIGKGATLEDVARHGGIKVQTVRWRLKRVFDKMGVHRQSDVARIASLVMHLDGSTL